ncbi:MAG TPA: glycoside hydrolase, partial [Terriglobales bacterium]
MTFRIVTRVFAVLLVAAGAFAQSPASKTDVERRVEQLLSEMTLQEKIDLLGGTHDFYTHAIPRLHIPSLRMSDGPMGVHDYGPTTAYPAPIAISASWDVELAKRFGQSM